MSMWVTTEQSKAEKCCAVDRAPRIVGGGKSILKPCWTDASHSFRSLLDLKIVSCIEKSFYLVSIPVYVVIQSIWQCARIVMVVDSEPPELHQLNEWHWWLSPSTTRVTCTIVSSREYFFFFFHFTDQST